MPLSSYGIQVTCGSVNGPLSVYTGAAFAQKRGFIVPVIQETFYGSKSTVFLSNASM